MKIPKLRFNAFFDNWKLKKIKEFTNSYSGGTPSANNKNYYSGNIPFIRSAEINSKTTKLCINKDALCNSSSKMVQVGTILYAIYGNGTSGKVGISKINGAINQAIMAINVKYNNLQCNYFLYIWLEFNRKSIRKKYVNLGGQKNLSTNIVNNISIMVPKSNEQQKIGSFFEKLDQLIQLQSDKLEHLKTAKKGYIQKFFSVNKINESKLFFKGFNKKKLSMNINNNIKQNKTKNTNEIIKTVESVSNSKGLIKQEHQFKNGKVASSNLSNYYVITPKTFVYNPSRINVGSIAYKNENGKNSIVSPLYVSFTANDKINDDYLWFWFFSNEFKRQRLKYSEGGVRDILSFNKLSEFEIKLVDIKEQQKIGQFLSNLDQQINLQQQKIDHLKQQKKAYLQKMFI